MACYKPLEGYRSRKVLPSGRRPVVFSRHEGLVDLPVQLPCGGCIGCRLDRTQQWATRCMHEASLHDCNCSLTLTYSDEFLPKNGSLVPNDVQLFLKRLRKRFEGRRISYFLCGEYGGEFQRAHYHVLLFGLWFGDSRAFKKSRSGHQLYRSATLDKLWPLGHADIGDLTFDSAAYAASYVVDKLTGEQGERAYLRKGRLPPFVRMSLRPAIGRRWIELYAGDVYPSDSCVVSGREVAVPAYYDRRFVIGTDDFGNPFVSTLKESVLEEIKKARAVKAVKALSNRTPRRLEVREVVARARSVLYKKGEA